MTADIKEITIYRNGLLKSITLQYFSFLLIFLLAPAAFLSMYFKILRDADFIFTAAITALTILILILFLTLVGIFIWLRKHWVNRIVVDGEGITFYGLFRHVQSLWRDVLSLESYTALLGSKMGKVTTRNGVFLFPYTMKRENDDYPQLSLSVDDWQWVDEHGNKEKAEITNCPLFINIQRQLERTSQNA